METTNYEEFFPNCNIDYVKDEKHWHQLRGKGIGGSDAGIAMNVNNYKTPYELWEEKTGVKKPVFQTSEAIEKGNALEPILIELFGVLYKNKFELIDTKDISLSNKKYPFLRANLDGAMIEIATKEKWGLEIKSTTIDSSQQYTLEKIAKATVIRTLGGIDSRAYQLMNRKIFSNIWRDYKNYFKLGSYRDTLKTEFENAKEYLESWSPEVNISLKIKEYNSQLSMNLDA